MMDRVLAFLRDRFGERSSQVQAVVVALVGLVALGVITTDDISEWTLTLTGLLAVAGPLAGMLVPDPSRPETAVTAEVAADILLRAAEDAARKRVPGADQVAADVAAVVEAAAPVLATAGVLLRR